MAKRSVHSNTDIKKKKNKMATTNSTKVSKRKKVSKSHKKSGKKSTFTRKDFPDPNRVVHIKVLDQHGFKKTCFNCLSLRIGATLVCFMTFFWATAELVSSRKFIARIFSVKGPVYDGVHIVFMIIIIGLTIASGILMVGILSDKYMAITIYLLYCLVFDAVYICFYLATVVGSYLKNQFGLRIIIRAIGAVLWQILFAYCLLVVNRFRLQVFISYQ